MSSGSLFVADNPEQDMGLGLLSALTSSTGSSGWLEATAPLRVLIQQMLSIYSSAVLVIAGFIVLYYFVLVIVDAAQTGKAFRRINPLWGPVRLVLAIGLLVPLGDGLNTGQRIVVQLSAWGSGLASRLWELAIDDTKAIRPMIARPNPVPATPLVRALILRDACVLYTASLADDAERDYNKAMRAYKDAGENAGTPPSPPAVERATAQPEVTNADGSVTVPYGWKERPYFCGGLTTYPINGPQDAQLFGQIKKAHLAALKGAERRSNEIAADYLKVAKGEQALGNFSPIGAAQRYEDELAEATGKQFTSVIEQQIEAARRQLGNLGWVGAPAYLDTVLRMNVRLISLNASLPQIDPPELLLNPPPVGSGGERKIYDLLRSIDQSWGDQARISPLSAAGLGGLSTLLSHAVTVAREVTGAGSTGHQLRAARDLLRTNDYDWSNFATRNPLVGLSELGAYLTGKSVELLAGAGVLGNVGPVTGPMVAMVTTLGIFAFIISVTLLLLLPLIPLVRFLLGLAIWLLEVFEALLAIPLVALAHLKADENGIAGPSAVLCYLMILKIMLRPALMVFGLLGGLIIFLIMLAALNTLMAGTMPGVVDSGQIASLWFVLVSGVYAVLVLGLANACFKLIDWLPQRTLTWLQGVVLPGRGQSSEEPTPAA